jgi:16S rRNA (cytosine967-C5)-methyltransferase
MAGLMQDKGEIVAVDKYEGRLKILSKNLERLGIKSIKPVTADALEFSDNAFDRVLADVPCSGTGTLSKKPDIKWKKDLLDLKKIFDIQMKFLQKASQLVKPGGILVYSTCSIEPEENIEIVKKFLSGNSDFKLLSPADQFPAELIDEGCIQTLPHKHSMDGAFSAKLYRLE